MDRIAWDTETRSFRWWEKGTPFLGSWDAGDGGNVAVLPPYGDTHGPLAKLIATAREQDGANMKFDAHMAREGLGVEVFRPGVRVDDVLMMSRLLFGNKRSSHGLKELATDFIDPHAADAEKEMQEKYKEITGRTNMEHDDSFYITWQHFPEIVEKYAGFDAEYTRGMKDILLPMLKEDAKLYRLYEEVERPVQEVLYHAERLGVHVDPAAVERLTKYYHHRDEEARRTLEQELGFVPEGEGSEDALREALPRVGVPLTEVTETTGELAVNRRALSKFADHPAVAALFEFRRVNKFLQTYILPLTGVEHIHPTFNQAQAWTGRMSGSNPNMQNLPKRTETTVDENLRVRSVFVPRPGYEFIIADFDSIEMRVLAYYLGDKGYRKLISDGDPHAITAAAAATVLGLPSNRPEDYLKSTDNRWFRDIAKQATYAMVYGGGGPVIMETINKMVLDANHPEFVVDVEQAREIRRRIISAIPGFKQLTQAPWRGKTYPQGRLYRQLMDSAVEVGDKRYGFVRTLGGRKQWINIDKSYVALSGLIQGSAADIMKMAAIAVREALAEWGLTPILFVHDELVVEVPIGWGERLLPVVVNAMEQAAIIDPMLKVEAHVTSRSYAHSD